MKILELGGHSLNVLICLFWLAFFSIVIFYGVGSSTWCATLLVYLGMRPAITLGELQESCYTETIIIIHKRFGRLHGIVKPFFTELLNGPSLHQVDVAGLQGLIGHLVDDILRRRIEPSVDNLLQSLEKILSVCYHRCLQATEKCTQVHLVAWLIAYLIETSCNMDLPEILMQTRDI